MTEIQPDFAAIGNSSIPFVHELTDATQQWLREFEGDRQTTREMILDAVSTDRGKAVAFLLNVIKSRQPERWSDLIGEHPETTKQIWDQTVGRDKRLVNIVQSLKDEQIVTECYVYTSDGCSVSDESDQLPLPPADWLIDPE